MLLTSEALALPSVIARLPTTCPAVRPWAVTVMVKVSPSVIAMLPLVPELPPELLVTARVTVPAVWAAAGAAMRKSAARISALSA